MTALSGRVTIIRQPWGSFQAARRFIVAPAMAWSIPKGRLPIGLQAASLPHNCNVGLGQAMTPLTALFRLAQAEGPRVGGQARRQGRRKDAVHQVCSVAESQALEERL